MSNAVKALGLTITGVLMACQASAEDPSSKLHAYIGMTASDFNAQQFVKSRNRPLPTGPVAWTGYDGGFDLVTRLGEREFIFPISGSNGGIQLSAWRGLEGKFTDPQIDTLAFTVEPQNLSFEQAAEQASAYCEQARAAGLTIPLSDAIAEPTSSTPDRQEAIQALNGVAACSLRNQRQRFDAMIVPHDKGNPATEFRIEVVVQAYFEVKI